ncbi:1374_t:CDS:1, partial [Ambispora leptoticha]
MEARNMNNVREIFQVGICYCIYLFAGAHNKAGEKLLHGILSLDRIVISSCRSPDVDPNVKIFKDRMSIFRIPHG